MNNKKENNDKTVYCDYKWCYDAEYALQNVYTFLRYLTDMSMSHMIYRILPQVDTWDDTETMEHIFGILKDIGVNNLSEFEALLKEYPKMDSKYSHEGIEKIMEYFRNQLTDPA